MKTHNTNPKKAYQKPESKKVNLDNVTSLYMMSEGTIPDPPWVEHSSDKNYPYRNQKAYLGYF